MVSTNPKDGSSVLEHKFRRLVELGIYPTLEKFYRAVESNSHSRASSLKLIPPPSKRVGGLGTTTYGEWCYTVGLFQGLIQNWLPEGDNRRILDIGCGVGRQYISLLPIMSQNDKYTGIDVSEKFVDICKSNYKDERATWIHTASSNNFYAKQQSGQNLWPFPDQEFDFMCAVSVWTHLVPADFRFYLGQVAAKLKVGGRAMITFFILDDLYYETVSGRTDVMSDYYPQPRSRWIFGNSINGDKDFFCPAWVSVPEVAVGVNEIEFLKLSDSLNLKILTKMLGSWKDRPGAYFQDIVVFEKTA